MDRLLDAFLKSLVQTGNLKVTSAQGKTRTYGNGSGELVAIRFTSRAWQRKVLLDPELKLGEAYIDEGLVVDRGTIADFLEIVVKNMSRQEPAIWSKALRRLRSVWRRIFRDNNLFRAARNVAHHYDLDDRLYSLFLDADKQYSCAYFETPDASLDDAQLAKKRHLATKLLLAPGKRVLDIGCGWGGLGLYLAETINADVTGVTLSQEQYAIANARAAEKRLSERARFLLRDYRDVIGSFDRIVSVGMFEHVGKKHYDEFFRKCFDVLSDDGVMLLHTIGRWDGPSDTNAWIWKYIFPGGYTPSLSELTPIIERSGFIISDIEVLRLHYAKTLRRWRERFLARRAEAKRIYDERFVRMWEFYLAGFEPSFRHYGLAVFQIQLAKKVDTVPMTRQYIYDGGFGNEMMRAAE